MNYQDLFLFKIKKKKKKKKKCRLQKMNVIGEARLFVDLKQTLGFASARVIWITRVFALIKIGYLQSSFYEVMWSSLHGDVLINNFLLKFGKIVVIKVSAPALYEMVL